MSLTLIERCTLALRMTLFLAYSIVIFRVAVEVAQQPGDGAKDRLVEMLWAFGLFLAASFVAGVLKFLFKPTFDTANILIIPLIFLGIVLYRLFDWIRKEK